MATIQRLLQPFNLVSGTRVLVAVSGGVDSMVLATMLASTDLTVILAHFNHHLRSGNAAEEALVRDYAATLGFPIVVGNWPQSAHPATGLEAAARTARYAFLAQAAAQVDAQVIMTAHHADDQAETVLFRLARSGSAVAAGGIAPTRALAGHRLIRPLLTVRKANLRAYAVAHHVPSLEDPTNLNPRFTRNRLRQQILPSLATVNPAVVPHFTRFAAEQQGLLALAEGPLANWVNRLDEGGHADWRPLLSEPSGLQGLVLARLLTDWQVSLAWQTQQQVLTALRQAKGTRRFWVNDDQELVVTAHRLRLVNVAAPSPVASGVLRFNQWHPLAGGALALCHTAPPGVTWTLPVTGPLTWRHRQAGDRLQLANGQHQLLRRWLINQKVPVERRNQLWVIAHDSTVFWVEGIDFHQLFHPRVTDILQPVIAYRLTDEGANHE